MLPDRKRHRRQGVGRLLPVAALLAVLASTVVVRAEAAQVTDGRLWLLRQYRVEGCEPMPSVPEVFSWLFRKALAIEEFFATSADCGQVGRRGTEAGNGWTYVFWSKNEDTFVAKWLRKAERRFGETELVGRKPGESFPVRSKGYEAFVMIQLGGEEGPVRLWAAGDVARLEAEVSVSAPGELQVRLESVTFQGKRCIGNRVLRSDEPGGPREALPCQAGG